MTDEEIEELAARLKTGERFLWKPDPDTCHVITHVGREPEPLPGDEPEPSLVAYLAGAGFGAKFIALYNVEPETIFSFENFHGRAPDCKDGCPCLHTTPCSEYCSCANPVMSGGCRRCAKYGSMEQKKAAAEAISEILDMASEGTTRLVLQTHDGGKWTDTSVSAFAEWRLPRLFNHRDFIRRGQKQSRLMKRIEMEITQPRDET